MVSRVLRHIFNTSVIKTIVFNFHYFPFIRAIRLPVLVARRTVFVKLSGSLYVERGCRVFIGYQIISIQDSKYSRTLWDVTGSVCFKGNAIIGKGSRLSIGGNLIVGNSFKITGDSTIICSRLISIGNDALLSWDCLVMDTDIHIINDCNGIRQNNDRPITIGNHVWIACRNTVLKGTTIPDGSVLAAGSLIFNQLKKCNCIYGSNGIIIKNDIAWHH